MLSCLVHAYVCARTPVIAQTCALATCCDEAVCFSASIANVYEAEKIGHMLSPLASQAVLSATCRPSGLTRQNALLPRDCLVLTVEAAVLLNLMIHYDSNGGPAPSGRRRYCIGSGVITERLHYLLTLSSDSKCMN